jgi:hypothetical protein
MGVDASGFTQSSIVKLSTIGERLVVEALLDEPLKYRALPVQFSELKVGEVTVAFPEQVPVAALSVTSAAHVKEGGRLSFTIIR